MRMIMASRSSIALEERLGIGEGLVELESQI